MVRFSSNAVDADGVKLLKPLGEPSHILSESVNHMVAQLLDDSHYAKMQKMLASKWDKISSLSATMKLMETYGVEITPEEEQRMSTMDEAAMIDALVMKMPSQSKEQFQEFFSKLQQIVSSAVHVRQGLRDGRPEVVTAALKGAQSTGVSPYILKMAVVQGGSEVEMLRQQHNGWIKDMDQRMSGLLRGQDEKMQATKALAAAREQLQSFTGSHNDKAKKVLMSLASGNSQALKAGAFQAWRDDYRVCKRENEIREEYEEQIQAAVKRLNDYREKQLGNVRGVLMRKAADGDSMLVQECFKILKDDLEEKKRDKESEHEVRAIEERLRSYASAQAENTKKVMTRMSAGSDSAIVNLTFQAWTAFCAEYKKDKETEDAVKAAELNIQKFLKSKSENAKGVLDRMSDGNDMALLTTVLGAWTTHFLEEKKSNEMAELLNGGSSKFGSFGERNASNAKNAMARQTEYLEHMLYLKCINAWRLHTSMEKVKGEFGVKIDFNKDKIKKVQTMFIDFAEKLDSGLKDGTPRDSLGALSMSTTKINKKGLSKSAHTVSLPNIHAKPGQQASPPRSGGRQHSKPMPPPPPPPPPRQAWDA